MEWLIRHDLRRFHRASIQMGRFDWMLNFRFRQVAVLVALAIAWTVAHADDARIVYYDVAGDSAQALRHELNNKGPLDHGQRFDAYTWWHVTWKYSYVATKDGCKFTEISTSLDGSIELPRWEPASGASDSLLKEWERYMTALRIHEDGHYAHGVAARDEIQALGESFQIAGSCTAIAKAFNDRAGSVVDRYAAMDLQYDRDTAHGKSQGATFPR